MTRSRVAAVLIGVVLLLAGALLRAEPVAPGAPVPEMRPEVGVQFHGMWSDTTDEQRALFLDQLAEAGGLWVRLDVSWAMLQPDGPDSYDLAWGVPFVDRVLSMITQRGLRPLVTLWLTPEWANGGAGERTAPDEPADYARAAQWAAQRWQSQVPAWQVWNEPNSSDFLTSADPDEYAALLRAAYPAIKAGNPDATVVFGGTQHNDVDWIADAYDAGISGSFDVMATHPYMSPADLPPEAPNDGTGNRLRHLVAVRELMVERGDEDLPVWLTEFGWSAHPNSGDEEPWQRGVTPQEQADYLRRTVQLVRDDMPYVTHMFWYTDRDRPDRGPQLGGYGLFDPQLSPKPAFDALAQYLSRRGAQEEPDAG